MDRNAFQTILFLLFMMGTTYMIAIGSENTDKLEERVYRLERKNDALQYETHMMCKDLVEQSKFEISCPVPSQILKQE